MRIRVSKFLTFFVLLANLVLFFISWKYFTTTENPLDKISPQVVEKSTTVKVKIDRVQEAKKFLQKSLTIIFRDFYHFDNDLKSSIDHLLALIPGLRILIISDDFPYPPINIFATHLASNQTVKPSTLIYKENVHFLWLSLDIKKTSSELNPLSYIQTRYALFMPDNFKLSNARQMFQRMIKTLSNDEHHYTTRWGARSKILITPFNSNQKFINYCFQLNADIPNWTLEYAVKNHSDHCDLVI